MPAADWRCGGRDYAHVAYERQRALKAEIIADALPPARAAAAGVAARA